MSRALQVLVVELLIAHVWGSYVAMAVGMLGLGRGVGGEGVWACAMVLAPVTFPGWVELSFSDSSVRWAASPVDAMGAYAVAGVLVGWGRNRDRWLRAMRRRRGECGGCGYNLRGNMSGVCPECGMPVEGRGRG